VIVFGGGKEEVVWSAGEDVKGSMRSAGPPRVRCVRRTGFGRSRGFVTFLVSPWGSGTGCAHSFNVHRPAQKTFFFRRHARTPQGSFSTTDL